MNPGNNIIQLGRPLDMTKIHPDLRPFVKDRKSYNIAKRYNPTVDKPKPNRPVNYPSYENYLNGGLTEAQLREEKSRDLGTALDRGVWNGTNTIGQYGIAAGRAASNVAHSLANTTNRGLSSVVGIGLPYKYKDALNSASSTVSGALDKSKSYVDNKLSGAGRWLNQQNGIVQDNLTYDNPDNPEIKKYERVGFALPFIPVALGAKDLALAASKPMASTAAKALTGNWTNSALLNLGLKGVTAPLAMYPTVDYLTGASHNAPDSSSRSRAAKSLLHGTILPGLGMMSNLPAFATYTGSRFRDIRDPFMEANGTVLANLAPHFVDREKGLLGSAAESLKETLGPDALQKLKDVDPARLGPAIGTALGKTDEGRSKNLETMFFNTRRDPYARLIGAQPAVRNLVTDAIAGRDQSADRDAFMRGVRNSMEDSQTARNALIGSANTDKFEQSKSLYEDVMRAHRTGQYENAVDPVMKLMEMWLGEDSTNPETYGYNQDTINKAKQTAKAGYEAAKERNWPEMVRQGSELFNIFKESTSEELNNAKQNIFQQ